MRIIKRMKLGYFQMFHLWEKLSEVRSGWQLKDWMDMDIKPSKADRICASLDLWVIIYRTRILLNITDSDWLTQGFCDFAPIHTAYWRWRCVWCVSNAIIYTVLFVFFPYFDPGLLPPAVVHNNPGKYFLLEVRHPFFHHHAHQDLKDQERQKNQ